MIVVPVGMQELYAVLDAPCCNDHIDDAAYGNPFLAQAPVIRGCDRGQSGTAQDLAPDRRKFALDFMTDGISSQSL